MGSGTVPTADPAVLLMFLQSSLLPTQGTPGEVRALWQGWGCQGYLLGDRCPRLWM